MPEGHTLHRLAAALETSFAGRVVRASSPQGRFVGGAALIDGERVVRSRAHGKHLFVDFAPADAPWPEGRGTRASAERRVLHVHLGLYGKFTLGDDDAPEERGALRLRLVAGDGEEHPWGDLRGPTACELLEPHELALIEARLGPDPLVADPRGAGRAAFAANVRRSRSAVGGLLMRQDLVAGIGNIYRAELLFRAGLDPFVPGRDVPEETLGAMWDDLVVLMRKGVSSGRIITTETRHRLDDEGRRTRAREGASYVYKRTSKPCRVCGTPILGGEMVARTIFWCPTCQTGAVAGLPSSPLGCA